MSNRCRSPENHAFRAQELHTLWAVTGPPVRSAHLPQPLPELVKKEHVPQRFTGSPDCSLKPSERRLLRWLAGNDDGS